MPGTRAPDGDGGRGLLLVGALAAAWGVDDRLGPGKTVWAECAVPVHRPVKCEVLAPHRQTQGTEP
ncbi:hypothetical protein [Streptomyces sp. JW3]|uniref:hypothetical protein n=1 Tax=Streptomyces sp. JW3 TaxID=3456955 RepID=UPI003FA4816A